MPHPIPDGCHTVAPHLVVEGAASAIAFYEEAFAATELTRMPFTGPDGTTRLMHATIRIGDSLVHLADAFPEYGSHGPQGTSPVTIHLAVTDADAAFERAVAAGATVAMPLADMFWGHRYGKLVDPFGHHWSIAEQIDDPSPEQMQERMAAVMTRTRH